MGVNIGALTVKVVVLREEDRFSRVVAHQGRPLRILAEVLAGADFAGAGYFGVSGHLGHISEVAAIQRAVAWYQPTTAPDNPSPLLYGDYFYVLFDFGFLSCPDARTGRQVFDKQRIRAGTTSFTASPGAAKGRISALSKDGDTFAFQSGPEYKLLHTNSLDEMCTATPAMAGDRLPIRTLPRLCCFRQAKWFLPDMKVFP